MEPVERATVHLTVNGQARSADADARLLLVHFIRDSLELTGTHIGCDTTNCGACTVILNGEAVKSCTMLAMQAEGGELLTIEGLEQGTVLHPLQNGFWQEHGLQCGFCTPGMIMVAKALLLDNPSPTDQEIRRGISGNLCRCTGYVNIVKAIQHAAAVLRDEAAAPTEELAHA